MIPARVETAQERLLASLILEVFRLNGRLLSVADGLVAKLGLTSAKWQVLGAIGMAASPEPVARIARNMGLRRQSVQRIVNELADDKMIEFQENPHHRRAKLVLLTRKGRAVFVAAGAVGTPWMTSLVKDLDAGRMIAAREVVEILRKRLDEMDTEA
jgi:DNA-binding MarR family transcriptional regulator